MQFLSHALVPALWLIWLVYWAIAAGNAKKNQRKESRRSRLLHLVPFALCAVFLATPNILGRVLEQRFIPASPELAWLAVALVAIGLGFSIAARVWLGTNWSAIVTLKQGHELIRGGPYALVRHPIYTGMLTALIGTGLAVGKWRALVALAIVTIAIVRKLKVEEQFLAEQFGDDYAQYRAKVAALIPFTV